ncbi:hypothetical protein K402DRAFT_224745 [Aulographum hederae CBS 113979]|uniref:Secreted protein n=1 Tax=Aulographum hederae CBS 113979 TaxID=1176131 RepID=A0A6G1HAP9_9PEZI|nr:hypothetical protein K402DRAFT_224745 [Aulographum hederae CBS 113979]
MKSSLSLLALAALAVASPIQQDPVDDVPVPDPSKVQFRSVNYGGTGCPSGTVDYNIAADASTVTIIFDSYVASVGPDVAVSEQRKNCLLHFDLLYPGGYQFSVFEADYRGYASIESGVTGEIKSTYYFSGQSAQQSSTTQFIGPWAGDYVKNDKASQESLVWSPCGSEGLLNINSQVRLQQRDKKASGLLTTDTIDAKFVQELAITWRKCGSKA